MREAIPTLPNTPSGRDAQLKHRVASLTNFAPHQFLARIVTADETWVHHYEPESKA
jgi:hypothetical protein